MQSVVIGTVLLMAGVAFIPHHYSSYYLNRVKWSNHQLEAITSVSLYANDYSEQIAELLLIGESEKSRYQRARADLDAAFDRLEGTTLGENAFLVGAGQPSDVNIERQRLNRMRQIHSEMDDAVKALVSLRSAGRFDDAVQLFHRDIENRLDAELAHLLRVAVQDEQEELKLAENQADVMWTRLIWVIALATLLALAISLLTAYTLSTTLLHPVYRLIAAAEAIRGGDLSARINFHNASELGLLASEFNRMGEQLEEHRNLVQDAQANLERQVADRTRELAKANHRLSGIDRARMEFLADISHELRTPLTALRGEAEVTLRWPPESVEGFQEVLSRIANLTRDMTRLVDDLLFLARNETQAMRFVVDRVRLQDIVSNVEREASVLGHGKQIALEVDVPQRSIWILADTHRLIQALIIVVDNAIKYSPSGRPVRLCIEADDDMATIIIRDQGQGISEEDLPHVFDRSFRGQSNSGSGLGIGLTIAKQLIEKHCGEIEILSAPGHYTEVRIRIPCAEEMQDAESAAGRG